MRRKIGVVAIMLFWCGGVLAQGMTPQHQRMLGKGYGAIAKGWQQHKVEAITALWTKDYTETQIKGKPLDRAAATKSLQRFMTKWPYSILMRFAIEKVTPKEGGKTLEVLLTQAGDIALGPKPKDGKSQLSAKFVHTWVQTPQGLRLKKQSIVPPPKEKEQKTHKAVKFIREKLTAPK